MNQYRSIVNRARILMRNYVINVRLVKRVNELTPIVIGIVVSTRFPYFTLLNCCRCSAINDAYSMGNHEDNILRSYSLVSILDVRVTRVPLFKGRVICCVGQDTPSASESAKGIVRATSTNYSRRAKDASYRTLNSIYHQYFSGIFYVSANGNYNYFAFEDHAMACCSSFVRHFDIFFRHSTWVFKFSSDSFWKLMSSMTSFRCNLIKSVQCRGLSFRVNSNASDTSLCFCQNASSNLSTLVSCFAYCFLYFALLYNYSDVFFVAIYCNGL